jgi:ArsR family metal-binding transcriptional regulator
MQQFATLLKRLPRTSYGACGEAACTAFAVKVWSGDRPASQCTPAFAGMHEHLKDALGEVCSRLGVTWLGGP